MLAALPKPAPSILEVYCRNVALRAVLGSAGKVTSGLAAASKGGRYNPAASFPVCYLAGTQTGAAFEVEQEQLLMQSAVGTPRASFSVTVQGGVWLNLTNPMICANLRLTDAELHIPSPVWKVSTQQNVRVPTQDVGTLARNAGYDGVLFPAIMSTYIGNALPNLYNLALFMDPANPESPASANVDLVVHHNGLLSP